MNDVLARIERGEIPLLTKGTLAQDIQALREDLDNWDHGHTCQPLAAAVAADSDKPPYDQS